MPKILRELADFRHWRASLQNQSLGAVFTMGALHKGHGRLMERSVSENDVTVVTLFVNPTQFNHPADFAHYPKTWEADLALAVSMGVDVVFAPSYEALYPDDYRYRLTEGEISLPMEGAHRPGHFDGVLTVVMKLLNLCKPRRAYFGQKDYQQVLLAKGMVEAFFMDIEIVGVPTVREEDGLACSSRNLRLTPAQRELAPRFAQALREGAAAVRALEKEGFEVEYVQEFRGHRLGAVRLGEVRLIDNVPL